MRVQITGMQLKVKIQSHTRWIGIYFTINL